MQIIKSIKQNLSDMLRLAHLNLGGVSLSDKIVVIESDDWGSLRSNKMFINDTHFSSNPKIWASKYLRYDCLEEASDLQELFKVLSSFRDMNGNTPVLTANTIVTNPDFEKIRDSEFQEYRSEYFVDTLSRRDGNDAVFRLYQEGYRSNLFIPQFHGREHLNSDMWMELLRTDDMFRKAFEHKVWGISTDVRPDIRRSIQAGLDTSCNRACESVAEGLTIFRELFGYYSDSFIANNYIWDSCIDSVLKKHNVSYIQGMKYQLLPLNLNGLRETRRRRFGESSEYGQFYGVRNCSLEVIERNSTIQSCLNEVDYAFRFRKPAIISMHRINFVGGIDKENRERGLSVFHDFLSELLKKWPEVNFMSTKDLSIVLQNKYKHKK